MQRSFSVVLVAALGLTATVQSAEPTEKARLEQLQRLITQLGSAQFQDREKATRELDALGAAALKELHRATSNEDAEVRHRADLLARSIKQRVEASELLAPSKVHLVFKDTPVPEAIDQFAKKTGFSIRLESDREKMLARRITLDTGETSFWDALAQFCDKAGLTERSPTAPEPGLNRRQVLMQQRFAMMRPSSSYRDGAIPRAPIMLEEGKAPAAPTWIGGALRVRALPSETRVIVESSAEKDVLFNLEVTVEPKLDLLRLLPPRITHARDDKGLALRFVPPASELILNPYEEILMIDSGSGAPASTTQCVPARLKLRDPAARQIEELQGSCLVELRTPPMALVTVNDVAKAAGKTFPGEGGTVKIETVKQTPESLQLKVTVETPANPGMGMRGAMIWNVAQAPGVNATINEDATGLALFDAAGKRIVAVTAERGTDAMNGATTSRDYTLSYKVEKGQEPARLVLTGRRTTFLDVPFTLKNIPLPGR